MSSGASRLHAARFRIALGTSVVAVLTLAACAPRSPPIFSPVGKLPDVSAPPERREDERVAESAPRPSPVIVDSIRRPTTTPKDEGPGEFTVSLTDASLPEAVKVILGDLLGETYSIDPTLQGRISMNASQPLSRAGLISLLEAALEQNGAALQRDASGFQVVPAAASQAGGSKRVLSGDQPGFGVTIIPVRSVGAEFLRALIEGPVLKPGTVRVDSARNILIVSGSSAERFAAAEAVAAFDVDANAGLSAGIFPVENADPATLIGELEAALQSGPGAAAAGAVRMRPITRLNAILAVTSSPELLASLQAWLGRLDVAPTSSASLRTYFLDNGKAEATARLLNELFTGSSSAPSATAPGESTTSSAPQQSFPRAGGAAPPQGASVRTIADPLNNALIVLADPAGHRLVQRALADIDRPPAQVMVDATIVEVTLTDRLQYGVQFFFESQGIRDIARSGRGGLSRGSGLNPTPTLPGFNFILENPNSVRVALDALSAVTNVKVMSSPSLVVMDNQTANLRVGDRVPVVTRQSSGIDNPNAPIINQIEFRDTGVILNVTPRVSSTSMVTIEVDQEVSSVSESSSAGSLTPTISQRKITSTVSIPSGQTLVLGGLIDDARNTTRSGVPVLSRAPVIGNLFSSNTRVTDRTELIVFLTPRVLRSSEEVSAASRELIARMDSIMREGRPWWRPLLRPLGQGQKPEADAIAPPPWPITPPPQQPPKTP